MKIQRRLAYLDTIRGLAALSVLCGHFRGAYGEFAVSGKWGGCLFGIGCDGFAAVSMFFVLSGFVLSLKYFSPEKQPYSLSQTLPSFVLSRLTRICIPFSFALLFSLALKHSVFGWHGPIPAPSAWIRSFWTAQDTVGHSIRQNFLFLPAGGEHLIPQDWTLTVELNLSLCIPFLILIASDSTWGLLFFSVVLVGLLKVHGFLIDFTMGILIAKYLRPLQAWFDRHPGGWKGLALFLSFCLYGFRETNVFLPRVLQTPIKESWVWYVTAMGSAGIIMTVIGSLKLRRFLEVGWLSYFGKISYSFYLLHFAVLLAVTPILVDWVRAMGVTSVHVVVVLGFIGTVLVTTCLAALSYRFVEVPSIRFGYFLTKRVPLSKDWDREAARS